jgi:hypothetical protein
MNDHDHLAEAMESAAERDDNFDDHQSQLVHEIVMMVNQIAEHGYNIDYSFRGYDNKHYVVLEGTKCYGQEDKVHSFLCGATTLMDWSRRKPDTNPLECHTGDCTSDHEEYKDTMTHDEKDGCLCQTTEEDG